MTKHTKLTDDTTSHAGNPDKPTSDPTKLNQASKMLSLPQPAVKAIETKQVSVVGPATSVKPNQQSQMTSQADQDPQVIVMMTMIIFKNLSNGDKLDIIMHYNEHISHLLLCEIFL